MSNRDDIIRVASQDAPNRCQAIRGDGDQCMNQKMDDSDFCPVHGGNRVETKKQQEVTRNYNLTRFRNEIDEKVRSSDFKSFREEIGILRLMLESRLNKCKDTEDLLLMSGPIGELVGRIQGAVLACHKLEGSMGKLLDKQAVIHFASVVIGIISKHVTPDEAAVIADDITNALANIGEEDE